MAKNGQIDEWGAVIQKQAENFERERNEGRIRKQFLQKQYGQELQMAAQKKVIEKQLQEAEKMDDYNRMQKNMHLRATLENLEK